MTTTDLRCLHCSGKLIPDEGPMTYFLGTRFLHEDLVDGSTDRPNDGHRCPKPHDTIAWPQGMGCPCGATDPRQHDDDCPAMSEFCACQAATEPFGIRCQGCGAGLCDQCVRYIANPDPWYEVIMSCEGCVLVGGYFAAATNEI